MLQNLLRVFKKISIAVFGVGMLFVQASIAYASDSISVTVTPPLFQLTIGPGESWASTLKVVNNNSFDVTYYSEVMDMVASGEEGRTKFIPLVGKDSGEDAASYALGQWIHISPQPITVTAGSSGDVPFTIEIPHNAEPGGHYAAILVGTQPGGLHATGTVLTVSSYVSSLLFVRIKGDALEQGRIREFITTNQLYQSPKADFSLRFENTGNTHVRPQGTITIYNMWGKERGQVLINQDADSNFGNVLPHSIRHFAFSWEGSNDPFDIGLYSAITTLSFGEQNKHNTSSKTYFWVIPVVPVAILLGVLISFFATTIWFIRRYIRRALLLEHQKYGIYQQKQTEQSPKPSKKAVSVAEKNNSVLSALLEPVREGVVDLRSLARANEEVINPTVSSKQNRASKTSLQALLKKYRLFIVFVVLVVCGAVGVWIYLEKVLQSKKGFQITDVRIQAEDVRR